MRRTRKWGYVEQEAKRLAGAGLSPREIAKKLDLSKSTVTRWIKAGKLSRGATGKGPHVNAPARQSPSEWAKSVRDEYALDSTDEQLVTLGESALSVSRDMTVTAQLQLAAGARFAAIVKQLNLPMRRATAEPEDGEKPAATAAKKNPVVVRKPAGDPRTLFMVPKAVGQ